MKKKLSKTSEHVLKAFVGSKSNVTVVLDRICSTFSIPERENVLSLETKKKEYELDQFQSMIAKSLFGEKCNNINSKL